MDTSAEPHSLPNLHTMNDPAKATLATTTTSTSDNVAAVKKNRYIKMFNSSALASFSALAREPAWIVLYALVFLASVSWYVVTSSAHAATTSETYMWVVCIPYTALMLDKFLRTIHAMQVEEKTYNESVQAMEAGDCASECDDHGGCDTLAMVGDVCVYAVGILLLCYFILPWELLRCVR